MLRDLDNTVQALSDYEGELRQLCDKIYTKSIDHFYPLDYIINKIDQFPTKPFILEARGPRGYPPEEFIDKDADRDSKPTKRIARLEGFVVFARHAASIACYPDPDCKDFRYESDHRVNEEITLEVIRKEYEDMKEDLY